MRTRVILASAFVGACLVAAVPGAVLGKGGAPAGGQPAKPPAEKPKPVIKVGEAVKDVSFDLLDGGKWSPADASGKAAILLFGGKDKLGDMRKLHDLLKGHDRLVVLGVLEGLPADRAKEDVKAEKEKIETTLGVDAKKEAVARFTASGTTEVVLIGTDGKLVWEAGSYDAKALEAQLEKLFPAKPADKPADKPGDPPAKK